jgi:hypothetical protein
MLTFGGEVEPLVPCGRFAAFKKSIQMAWNSPFFGKITGHFSLIVPPYPASGLSSRFKRGDAWLCKWEIQSRASAISLYGRATVNSKTEEER